MYGDCPYCYRPKGKWLHDPTLLPNGAPYDWVSDTELIYEPGIDNRWYKGFYQVTEEDITELQTELETLEIDNGVTPLTVFSKITPGTFQITGKHIKEMRDSVDKILTTFGLTKTDYFNYDEEGNHIIHPNGDKIEWTDPITDATDLQKFQVKYIHIEDLRHFIQTFWLERWNITPIGVYFNDTRTIVNGEIYNKLEDFNFNGDKGIWITEERVQASTLAPDPWHLYGSIITISSKSESVDDGSGISTKLFLRSNLDIVQGGDHTIASALNNSSAYKSGINYKLKTNTTLSFLAITNLTCSGTALNLAVNEEITLRFSNGNYLFYYYWLAGGISPTVIYLTKTQFENFNRNIYDDYNTIYGFVPSGLTVSSIKIATGCSASYGGNETIVAEMYIDNIKFSK